MKKIVFLVVLFVSIFVIWCDGNLKFMDIDNPNAADDLKGLIQSWNLPKINAENIIPESLSWTWDSAKWYVNQYYEDSVEKYVDKAKEGWSWARETLKWYYNSWVDELNQVVSEKVNATLSWELNKLKI